jgi:enoyl-CoA hydratase/carnithine racemase
MKKLTAVGSADPDLRAHLDQAGLPSDSVTAWLGSRPEITGDYRRDAALFSPFWRAGSDLLAKLPKKPARNPAEARAAETIARLSRAARERFLTAHLEALYRALTQNYEKFIRVEELVHDAAALVPGLAPAPALLAAEAGLLQRDKEGVEIDQGILLSRILAHPAAGTHLCHAMLLPKAESLARLPQFLARGSLDLGATSIERRGAASFVFMRNPRFLNAEDESTIDATETAIDLAIMDPGSSIAVLRGDTVEHPKYRGQRVFSTGINLTHLYQGKISYVWYIKRDMGFVNKIFRGVATAETSPDEVQGTTSEKPWIAAVDKFAIGGGCQYLLAMDYVVAANDAYLTLPARKEGIVPGLANLRMPRFTGDRIARQAIMNGRRLECDSFEGRLICDEVVAPEEMDGALERVVDNLTSSGVVSAASNRRAFRVGEEPLDLFRRYMAVYAREQAHCHFSPALSTNLERHWNAQERKG